MTRKLILRSPRRRLGVWLTAVTTVALCVSCGSSPSTARGGSASSDEVSFWDPASSVVVRAVIGGRSFDLSLDRILPSDVRRTPASSCLHGLGPNQYSLNWAAADGNTRVPKIALTLAAADGAPMTMGFPDGKCRLAKNLKIDAMPAGTEYTIGGALPRREGVTDALRITINSHATAVHLRPVCTDAETALDYDQRPVPCADNPAQYDAANGYSFLLTIS